MGAHSPAAKRRLVAFTLIEMLVATVLAAVLMSAVLGVLAGVARDRRKLAVLGTPQPPAGIVDLVRWDVQNASSISADSVTHSTVLIGNGGIDPKTFAGNGRQVQITYQLQSGNLWRVQEYLDDPGRSGAWAELVAGNVSDFSLGSNGAAESYTPSRVRFQLISAGVNIDELLWIK